MRIAPSRPVRAALAVLVLAGVVALSYHRVDWRRTEAVMLGADGALIALAAVINLLTLFCKGAAWWVFLRSSGVRMAAAMRATVAGAALNNILPWNLGEVARVGMLAAETRIPAARALGALVLERLTGILAGLVMLALFIQWFPLPRQLAPAGRVAIAGTLVGLALLMLARWRKAVAGAAGISGRTASRGGERFGTAGAREATLAIALGVAGWLAQLVTYEMSARAVQLPLSAAAVIALVLAVNLGFIFRLTPGSIGVFQLAYVATAVALGLPGERALAASLLLQAVQVVPVIVIAGLLYLWTPRGRSAPLQRSGEALAAGRE